jgi:UDP:flavonoid glycosyltransferase YjiC (YdhE family)
VICLMPNCAYLSETSRMLAIWRALEARGARTLIATHGGTYERLLSEAGAPYRIVGPRMDAERCRRFVAEGPGLGPPGQSFYSDEEMLSYARAEAELFRAEGVSAVVTGFTLTPLLSSRLAGVPLITEHGGSMVPIVAERNLIPAMPTPPAPIFKFMPRPLAQWLQNQRGLTLDFYTAGFNRAARALGVEGVPSLMSIMTGDITLVTEAPEILGIPAAELEAWTPRRPEALRGNPRLRYVGPIFAELDLPIPERVERFLSRPGPVVYVALTSTSEALVRRVIEQVARPGVRVLVAGTVHALSDLEGPDVMIEGVLPSHLIAPRVDLAVLAGGQGSLQNALAHGVPLIAIPLHREQDLNAYLVERVGAGRAVPPPLAMAGKVGPLARRMLADNRYRRAARRVRDLYARLDGPGRAAEVILETVATPASGNADPRQERL